MTKKHWQQISVKFDIIYGRSFLTNTGINIKFSNKTCTWIDITIPMKPDDYWTHDKTTSLLFDTLDSHLQHNPNEIKESKYEKVDPNQVAQDQTHLNQSQRDELALEFTQRKQLFNGKLGKYTGEQIKLHLKEDAIPRYFKPYPIPRAHKRIFKQEAQRLMDIDVIEPCRPSEWGSPQFIAPKKDSRVRWLTDMRYLNTQLIRQIYPLPLIQDILTRQKGYKYFTKIDISMQYYTFELDEESRKLCVITTPFGNFRYKRLPMGCKQSPDIAQSIMESILNDLEETEVYMDDIGIFSNNWDDHIKSINKVLDCLESNGFTVNPLKCEWGKEETDWLGYWLTPTGLKPWKKKVESILKLAVPKTLSQLCSFIGAITYYREMWPKRAQILSPLTELTKKGMKFLWGKAQQTAFDTMRALIIKDVLLTYPDPNKSFHIETDASDYQVGAVIKQNGKPIAYFSQKLHGSQLNYTVGEKEMLMVVMVLNKYRSLLYGRNIDIYTDHKNLTFHNLKANRVLHWRLFLEEVAPTFHYKQGDQNVIADALSRLLRTDAAGRPDELEPVAKPTPDQFSMELDDPELLECFLNYPTLEDNKPFPLDYQHIHNEQQQDPILQQFRHNEPNKYPVQNLNGVDLICYLQTPNSPWKIYLPSSILDCTILWFHQVMNHNGMNRLYEAIHTHFHNFELKQKSQTSRSHL